MDKKQIRLKEYDYNTPGAYFITICTEDKKRILSEIVGGDAPYRVKLLPDGIIADKIIQKMNCHYENISVDKYVIMPNHIHLIIIVNDNGASGTSPPTKQHSVISRFVSTLKDFVIKNIIIIYGNGRFMTTLSVITMII